MSLQLTLNVVEDSGLSRTFNGLMTIESAKRTIIVSGLAAGGPEDAATAHTRALQTVQSVYPPFSTYGGSSAQVNAISSEPIPQTDDAVKVVVTYQTPVASHGSLLTISDSTVEVPNTSQFFINTAKKPPQLVQLTIAFQAPSGGQNNGNNNPGNPIKKTYNATMHFPSTLRTVILAGTILGKNLAPFRAAVRGVNDKPWNGLPAGFWRCRGFSSSTQDLMRTYQVQVEFITFEERDWSTYEVLRDRNTGQFITLPKASLNRLAALPYKYGVNSKEPGILKIGPYQPIDFSMFAIRRPQ